MPAPLQSRIPLIPLDSGCTVQFEAVSPTTGAAVAGVKVSNVAIYGSHQGAGEAVLTPESGQWLNLPQEG